MSVLFSTLRPGMMCMRNRTRSRSSHGAYNRLRTTRAQCCIYSRLISLSKRSVDTPRVYSYYQSAVLSLPESFRTTKAPCCHYPSLFSLSKRRVVTTRVYSYYQTAVLSPPEPFRTTKAPCCYYLSSLLYKSPSLRELSISRMPTSASTKHYSNSHTVS